LINIRTAGTIPSFAFYWKLVNNSWIAQPDTTRWVWTAETTMYNRRGIEIENRNPFGQYTAGLFGFDNALPVAVAQNARYREIAFDGFEDYSFGAKSCDSACAVARSFDFSGYMQYLDSTQQHTGKYSLRVAPGSSYGVSADIVQTDSDAFGLSFNTDINACSGDGQVLKSIKAGKDALIPVFSPLAGRKLLLSAWVKEGQDCKGTSYAGNEILIKIKQAADSTIIIATPKGSIIEGWQRYEQVLDIPVDAVSLTVYLRSTGTVPAFFDDIRIHPYNANMKSFVYSPSDLRLMAELDENNYATMYEYDDDGTLIRLKKETERGVKTIKETRSALLKEELP
jgi:hypothetical protein